MALEVGPAWGLVCLWAEECVHTSQGGPGERLEAAWLCFCHTRVTLLSGMQWVDAHKAAGKLSERETMRSSSVSREKCVFPGAKHSSGTAGPC